MPIKKTKSGGYKFGTHGKVYRGRGATAKARKQSQAIHASMGRRK